MATCNVTALQAIPKFHQKVGSNLEVPSHKQKAHNEALE